MTTTATTGFWARQWARARYVIEAMEVSPAEIQENRIARLERAVAELQGGTDASRTKRPG